jgi:hypothetical protein
MNNAPLEPAKVEIFRPSNDRPDDWNGNNMNPLPQSLFDVYAISLPRGHGFGDRPPVEAWQSEDGLAWGAVTRDVNDGNFGALVMRRREDYVWALVHQEHGFANLVDAGALLKPQ